MTDDNPNVNPPMPDGYDQVRVPIADVTDERPANLDEHGVAHFCAIPPVGEEFCGGCAQPWPCPDAVHLDVAQLPDVR